MPKLLQALGFKDNPFANYSAENEPAIDQYFVRPPYYEFVLERGLACRSVVLFGARGAGKSATRIAFAKEAWRPTSQARPYPLLITLDDFSRILLPGLNQINLGSFVTEVGFLVVESLLLWLAAQDKESRDLYLGTLTNTEEAMLISLVRHFYLSQPEYVRQTTIDESLKLLRQSWTKRTKLWFEDRWDHLAALVATLAQTLGNKWAGTEANVEAGLAALLRTDRPQWNEAHFARALLGKLVQTARMFGFAGVTALVDKVDETVVTTNSARASAQLVYPILANTQLLEIDGFGWLMFLWDKLSTEYSSDQYPVRLDKIPNATISWDERFLTELTERRLDHYSAQQVPSFTNLCEADLASQAAFEDVVRMSMWSPRELIRILDTIVREHDDEYSLAAETRLLTQDSIDRALDKYSVEAVRRMFDRVHLQQLSRLRLQTFINKDVQAAFRINAESARNRIRSWVDAGIVTQTGSRQAEGGVGGKPWYEYSITDLRVKRLITRDLDIGLELDDLGDVGP
jgi:hypothetical protein